MNTFNDILMHIKWKTLQILPVADVEVVVSVGCGTGSTSPTTKR